MMISLWIECFERLHDKDSGGFLSQEAWVKGTLDMKIKAVISSSLHEISVMVRLSWALYN